MADTDINVKCVNALRCLAADMPTQANSGHPGAPIGCAPMAYVLFKKIMQFNPSNPDWVNRDRFVLSNGHACALLYSLLHLTGFKISLDDLKAFRTLGSITPGHPERHETPGVEVTTGPLGQGFCNAVGMAIAQESLRAEFNQDDCELIDNYVYVIMGDGCHQEGVTGEAASLAGHLKLGRLICLYDDNDITIDGGTELSFTEDVGARFESYGWHVLSVADGNHDLAGIEKAILEAKKVTDKPTLIKVKTTIGLGSAKENTANVHGSPLSKDDLANVKTKFGMDPSKTFYVPDDVAAAMSATENGATAEAAWNAKFAEYTAKHPEKAAQLQRRLKKELPADWKNLLPKFTADKPADATRKISGMVLNSVGATLTELIGGSADLTPSNCTWLNCSHDFQAATRDGRYIRYGVREHGMAAIMNGIAAYGAHIPYGATFLNFIGYALGAMRLSAISHLQVIYVMTHDSIGLGEDGPTHQPIESLASLRAMPNMYVFRPADGNETTGSYIAALELTKSPSVLCLTRQNVKHLAKSSPELVARGAYVAVEVENPDVTLVASGSEVGLCVEAAELSDLNVRVVSMPCWELFDQQPAEYRNSVLLPTVPTLSVEAASITGWERYAHAHQGMTTFGASAPAEDVFKHFGFTPENLAAKAAKLAAFYKDHPVPDLSHRFEF